MEPDDDQVAAAALEAAAAAGIAMLVRLVGDDPDREGVRDTPARVVRALREMCAGYTADPAAMLATTFPIDSPGEMVVVRDIPFTSLCEHHLLPFIGTATVGYVPHDRVVGLSKVARVVEAYARRLQMQERMTTQIADVFVAALDPVGVGVVVRGTHSCMAHRGVGKTAQMVTSALRGTFLEVPQVRAEFLSLTRP